MCPSYRKKIIYAFLRFFQQNYTRCLHELPIVIVKRVFDYFKNGLKIIEFNSLVFFAKKEWIKHMKCPKTIPWKTMGNSVGWNSSDGPVRKTCHLRYFASAVFMAMRSNMPGYNTSFKVGFARHIALVNDSILFETVVT